MSKPSKDHDCYRCVRGVQLLKICPPEISWQRFDLWNNVEPLNLATYLKIDLVQIPNVYSVSDLAS